MDEVSIIGIDLVKRVFQLHGAGKDGSVVFRRQLSRGKVLAFFAERAPCVVAMEACASAHHWGRELGKLGHEVRLIHPAYVKPFVKRQKNDTADAEAIVEAALRPTMRFVAVKEAEQQAAAMLFKTRDLLVRQRTQTINALRGHLAEHGLIVPQGTAHVLRLRETLNEAHADLPDLVVELAHDLMDHVVQLNVRIGELDARIRHQARQEDTARRLTTIPGIGPVCAVALTALAPPRGTFVKGRDFAAWVGLVPRQASSGGKTRLGRTSRMGQRDLRRLLIIGAMAVVRWAARHGAPAGSWLARMLAVKPRMLVAVALANKIARVAWALMSRGGVYKASALPA